MFCPNCAASNEARQHYCRTCGLKLDAIAAKLEEQKPSAETVELLRRKKLFDRLWKLSISISGFVGFMIIVSIAVFYKLILLGPEILFGSAMGAVVLFAILAAFFYAYPRLFMDLEQIGFGAFEHDDTKGIGVPTGKLLDEPVFDPASVTEDSTKRLRVPR